MSPFKKSAILILLFLAMLGLGQNCGRFKSKDLGDATSNGSSGGPSSPLPSSAPSSSFSPNPSPTSSPSPFPIALPPPSVPPTPDEQLNPSSKVPSINHISVFKNLMQTYGRQFCNQAQIDAALGSTVSEGNVWYYDGTLHYHNTARYMSDSTWYTCSDYVARAYRNWINGLTLVPGDYRPLGGWRLFPHGLQQHFSRTQEAADRTAILRLATQSAFMSNWDVFTVPGAPACAASREVAYLINSFLVGKDFGADPGPKLNQVLEWALGHLDQWFVAKTCLGTGDQLMQPFMVGLTTEALIFAYEKIEDPILRQRILSKVNIAMDELWLLAWSDTQKAMFANTATKTEYWPVVNTVIGASYTWLWQVTGIDRHRERADKLWDGAMTMDFPNQIWSGKQYSQIFRRAYDHLKWRSQPPGSFVPPTKY